MLIVEVSVNVKRSTILALEWSNSSLFKTLLIYTCQSNEKRNLLSSRSESHSSLVHCFFALSLTIEEFDQSFKIEW